MLDLIKILPVGAQLFHAGGGWTDAQMDRHEEANSRFSQFCERAKKPKLKTIQILIFSSYLFALFFAFCYTMKYLNRSLHNKIVLLYTNAIIIKLTIGGL